MRSRSAAAAKPLPSKLSLGVTAPDSFDAEWLDEELQVVFGGTGP